MTGRSTIHFAPVSPPARSPPAWWWRRREPRRSPASRRAAAITGCSSISSTAKPSLDVASQICVAALDAGITPVVRVPANEPAWIGRVLDGGAVGVVVPHIDCADDARRAADAARYPPAGSRSLSGPAAAVRLSADAGARGHARGGRADLPDRHHRDGASDRADRGDCRGCRHRRAAGRNQRSVGLARRRGRGRSPQSSGRGQAHHRRVPTPRKDTGGRRRLPGRGAQDICQRSACN